MILLKFITEAFLYGYSAYDTISVTKYYSKILDEIILVNITNYSRLKGKSES